jgi:hypothetical protein
LPAVLFARRARGRPILRDLSYICKLKEVHMRLSHSASAITIGTWLAIGVPISASANVITDWDEKAVAVLMPAGAVGVSQQVYTAQRTMGMVHAAMFDTRLIHVARG